MHKAKIPRLIIWLVLGLLAPALSPAQDHTAGQDVIEAFSRAAHGQPLRYVAIGGSITQAGEGWIGDWLRQQFPRSKVMAVNSGISGTGSSLGVFRIDRDVIAYQPDLVAIEFCVNDLGLPDEDAIRYMESLVVRLKSLPHPPAIIIVEAATRDGVNLARHRSVAQHYGILEIDLQAATTAHLKTSGEPWPNLFGDTVHPNRAGHTFYRTVMEKALQPLADEARRDSRLSREARKLPPPLSTKPLVLDGRMVPLQALREPSGDWISEQAPRAEWSRFFEGVLAASKPGSVLQIPFRGTAVGVFFAMNKDYGSFYMNVDSDVPIHVSTNTRTGFSSTLLATNLPAREHLFAVVLPPASFNELSVNGPVKLGYLLLAGETRATGDISSSGAFDLETLKTLRFRAIPASAWSWTGSFASSEASEKSVDARQAISKNFLGEESNRAPSRGSTREWHPVTSEGSIVDFRALTGSRDPAVAYAETLISSDTGGSAILSLDVDYYAQIWLNGELILTMDGPHPRPKFILVTLRPGSNSLMCKVGAGSEGFSIQVKIAELTPAKGSSEPKSSHP